MLQPCGEPEGAALPDLAADPCATAHQFSQSAGDGQAQARAAVLPRHGVVDLLERHKQAINGFRRDANAVVFHLKSQQHALIVFRFNLGSNRDEAVVLELDGIAGVVQQGLPDAGGITHEAAGQITDIQSQLKLLGLSFADQHGDHVLSNGLHINRLFMKDEFAGFNTGDIQNVTDDLKQVRAGGIGVLQILRLLGGDTAR